jgi:hypothetical protein
MDDGGPGEIPGLTHFVQIGDGGFAIVYKAHQASLRRDVAVKVITTPVTDATARSRFERECEAVGRLSWHPNVVSVFDAGVMASGRPYLVMELLPAGSLGDQVKAHGPLPWPDAVGHVVLVSDALEAAHQAGLLHRDVKPENVLIGTRGVPRLADFGIAQIDDRSRSATQHVTASLFHAAPELFSSRPTVAADVYALGSTLFTLMAGAPPFYSATDETITPLLVRIATAPVPDLRPSGVPSRVCDVMERALAKDAGERWQSAAAFEAALKAAAVQGQSPQPVPPPDTGSGRTVALHPPPPAPGARGPTAPKRSRADFRTRIVAAGVGTVLVVLLGVALGATLGGSGEDQQQGSTETTASTTASDATASEPFPDARPRAEIPVYVGNGAGVSGGGAVISDELVTAGFGTTNPAAGNAASTEVSQVYYRQGWQAEAAAVATTLGLPTDRLVELQSPNPFQSPPDDAQVLVQLGTDLAA